MDDFNIVIKYLFNDDDLVCILTLPAFEKRMQRFLKIKDLKTKKWMQFLKASNAHNCNIYLSLFSFTEKERKEDFVVDTVHHLFLDFDDLKAYKRFRRDFKPSVVIATSRGKFQCFLKLSKGIPKMDAKRIMRGTAKKYGADILSCDVAHVFRLPSFYNYKYPQRPLVTISEFNPKSIFNPSSLPIETIKPEPEIEQKAEIIDSTPPPFYYDYNYFLGKAPLRADGTKDISRADMAFAIYLVGCGLSEEEIKERLLIVSQNIQERKKSNLEKYLNITVKKAMDYQRSHYKPL
jgi:hypothetical protein